LPSYLSFYEYDSRRRCHLDNLSLVCSLIPRSSQSSARSENPLTELVRYGILCLLISEK
jgi:hypothetical protein